MRRYT